MKTLNIIRLVCIFLFLSCAYGYSQEIVQTIRGSVVDQVTHLPLTAANVAVYKDSVLIKAGISDKQGDFRFENVSLGRYLLVISYIGYRSVIIPDIIVNSSKEIILSIEMEESPSQIDEVYISAAGTKGNSLNKMAFGSARAFSAEESERYAGSRGDPARMASNFAGVQGNDDSNNDLVIRGNSPLGVLWRLEGVNIPNPNHFGVSGTTGGPVTILNNRVLEVSDFMTGAFPAEFGNSIAGVFDLKMRNGNNEKHEFSGQFGFLGTEIMAEGPLHLSKKSSYISDYRYSTMAIFQSMGISIGTDAVPRYQDLSYKLNIPLKKNGNLSFFGIGGLSAIDILASKEIRPSKKDIYGDEAMNEHFRTGMGVTGLNYSRSTGEDSWIKVNLSVSREHQSNHLDKVFRKIVEGKWQVDSIREPNNGYYSNIDKYSLSVNFNKRLIQDHYLRSGIIMDFYHFDMLDSIFNESYAHYFIRMDNNCFGSLIQPYIQWKGNLSGNLSITGGIHSQVLELGNNMSGSLEPRLGIRYRVNNRNTLGFATGLHSQMLPPYIYFARKPGENFPYSQMNSPFIYLVKFPEQEGPYIQPNSNLDFIKSYHTVLSWDHVINTHARLKIESYFQYLYNVPVERITSSYSVLDEGHNLSRFFPDSLVNKGKGKNMGLEFTVEKFFSNSYFLMFTASVYDAKRTGSDNIYHDAIFNGCYILNTLASKEFSWGVRKKSSFMIGGKMTLAGGKRYTPVDLEASALKGDAVFVDKERNTHKFNDYFRFDIKINYRLNSDASTHELGLDIINVTNHSNILKQTYLHGGNPPLVNSYQLGTLPIFYYRIDF